MVEIESIFQDNIFQDNTYQGKWGDYGFQRGVFQLNIFDVRPQVIRVISESVSLSEATNRLIDLFKIVNETEQMSEAFNQSSK